ncbi:DUF748 domain-containing protein [Chryseolinea sp. T2]|uniref:DUF748 domain-containing protein n=1 Tax=Chryseolinea sp. T2 TaxID=3129255 RepID=UPI003076EDC1
MSALKSFLKRRVVRFVIVTAVVIAGLVVIASFSLTRYIEEHSEEWTGRKITLSSVWFNPFNCSLTLTNVKVFEKASSSVFVSFSKLYVNASPWSYWLDDEIRLSDVALKEPYVYLQMNSDETFNYDDLVKRFASSGDSTDSTSADPLRYVIEKIRLEGGSFSFIQEAFKAGVDIHDILFTTSAVAWNQPVIKYNLEMAVKSGGHLASAGSFNRDSLSYHLTLKTDSLELGFLLPFADKVLYVSDVKGNINTDLKLAGTTAIPVTSIVGLFSLNQFYLADTLNKPVASLETVSVDFGDVKPVKGIYNIKLARLDKPYLKFDLTPKGNNLLRITGTGVDTTAAIPGDTLRAQRGSMDPYLEFFRQINQYLIEWGREYAINSYAIDSLVVSRGSLDFSDYTLKQPFHFLTEHLSVSAHQITNAVDSVQISVSSLLNHSGSFNAGLKVSTKNIGDMNLHYDIDSLKITDFSPYSEYYVAHPFWDGLVSFNSTTSVSNHYLKSQNRLFVTNLEVGDKVESETAIKLPLKLAVSLLKDVDGNVDLNIPLKGDVNDPKFRVMPVVWQVLKNLIVKAAASPYKLVARAVDAKEDDVRDIKYDYLQSDLRKRQNKTVTLLARILNQKKSLSVTLVHVSNTNWEAVQYALYKARLDYYTSNHNKTILNYDDSLAADAISASDSLFLKFIEQKTGKQVASSDIETLAVDLSGGRDKILQAITTAADTRKRTLVDALQRKGVEATRITIKDASPDVVARHRDRPRFDIQFSGESSGPAAQRAVGQRGDLNRTATVADSGKN